MPKLSVALIFKDEAANLPSWLAAVRPFADEIVALDSGSSDSGPDILKAHGVRVEYQPWLGYAQQRNKVCSLCTGDWILSLDADEWPDQDFIALMQSFKQQPVPPKAMGYYILRKVFFFGRFLRFGGFFPEKELRLMRAGQGHWPEREVHESLRVNGPVEVLQGGYINHYSYRNIGDYLKRLDRYSALAAREMFREGKTASPLKAVARGSFAFFNRYVMRLGFMDGFPGYLAARLEGIYTLSKYTRLWEMRQDIGNPPEADPTEAKQIDPE